MNLKKSKRLFAALSHQTVVIIITVMLVSVCSSAFVKAQTVNEYKYFKQKAAGKALYHMSGSPKSLMIEPQKNGGPFYYYGDDRFEIKKIDRRTSTLSKNDSVVAVISDGLKIGEEIYTYKDRKREWEYLKDGQPVISGALIKRNTERFMVLKYADGIQHEELLIVMSLIKGHILDLRKSQTTTTLVVAATLALVKNLSQE